MEASICIGQVFPPLKQTAGSGLAVEGSPALSRNWINMPKIRTEEEPMRRQRHEPEFGKERPQGTHRAQREVPGGEGLEKSNRPATLPIAPSCFVISAFSVANFRVRHQGTSTPRLAGSLEIDLKQTS